MWKGYIAYTTPGLTIGAEAFINNIRKDTKGIRYAGTGAADTLNTKAKGISFYIHGNIVPNKLRYFARVDFYNPNKNLNNGTDSAYSAISSPNGL